MWEKVKKQKFSLQLTLIFFIIYSVFFNDFFRNDYYPWDSDASLKHFPAREYLYTTIVKEHRFPFWTDKVYSGFPIFADLELGYLNPVNVLSVVIFGPFLSYKVLHLLTFIIGSWGMYAFLKNKGISLLGTITAVIVFLYTFFTFNHQIHFNIILTYPLLPLSLYLVDRYFAKNHKRYLVYQILLFSYFILWGHLQTVFICGLGVFIYSFFAVDVKKSWKNLIVYWLLTGFFSVLLTLPQLIPTYNLYNESTRDEQNDYRQGSFNFVMFSNFVLPMQYGPFDDYDGIKAFEEGYSYTEIYVYVGIAAFIFGLFSFLFSKDKLSMYAFLMIFICLTLVSVRYLPNSGDFFILNMFRHWNRAVILASLGLAILCSKYFQEKEFKFNLKRLIIAGLAISPFILKGLLLWRSDNFFMQQALLNSGISWDIHTAWFTFLICSVICTVLILVFNRKVLLPLVILLILVDTLYYIQDPKSTRIQKVENPSSSLYIDGLTDKMVVDYFNDVRGYQYLNANYRSPFGYSQLLNSEYLNDFKKYEVDKHMTGPPKFSRLNRDFVEKLDIEYIIMEDGSIRIPREVVDKF